MKKITLLVSCILVSGFGFSQTTMTEIYGESDPVIVSTQTIERAPCNQNVASNALENGLFFGGATNQALAIDIDVPADMTFSIEEIIPTFADEQTTMQFVFYTDLAGLPDTVIETVVDFTVTDDVITGNNFGFDFHQYTVLLDTPFALEGGPAGTKYWMEIICDAVAWESTSASATGLPGAFKNDNTAQVWTIGTTDYVYELNGDCSPTLGVGETLAEVAVIYPNPVSNTLTIQVPATVEIQQAVLYDILGKNTGVQLVNGTMNTSSLARGVYMLNIKSSAGDLTQKIVKQ
ncbi:putative secreted protein (Por secretion system target) [Ulvibacter sp. MAR_2010_11]|uniref:T9SS type A sorting domain-containing protein n=1 Tax=Ulvibacter sp. MAR_2010_11 TaxID=1250229 RepID=UPI000C2CE2CA|nr:T9SS type A sorting domain-containing protein [Ulvibacter sp. MAR_2010_11]PKA82241.1 putative secreted protein (Por secretion system target) [Ulvibacter sp. MAR_2010_11]